MGCCSRQFKQYIYILGQTWGNLRGVINRGDADFFVMKYSTDGLIEWFVEKEQFNNI